MEITSSAGEGETVNHDAKATAKEVGSTGSASERETSKMDSKPTTKPRKKRGQTRISVMERRARHFQRTANTRDDDNGDGKSGKAGHVKYDRPYEKDKFPPRLPEYETDSDGNDCGCMVQVIGIARKVNKEGALGDKQTALDYFHIQYTTATFDLKVNH